MSKASVPKFWKPAVWVVSMVAVAALIAAGAGKVSSTHAREMARATSANAQLATVNAERSQQIRASLDALPLAFEANQGQIDPQVKYTARGNGYTVFLTENKTVFALSSVRPLDLTSRRAGRVRAQKSTAETGKKAAINMRLLGGNPAAAISSECELPGTVNYYIGSNSKNWRTGVKRYSQVAYRDVYPGVNMVYHGEQRQLEFDFVVAPGADAKAIGMGFEGAQGLATDNGGNLVLTSAVGDVVVHKPVAYQEKDGKRENVDVTFQIRNREQVGLQLGFYDPSRELVIDPSLSYSTYLGGSAEDDALAIAVDGSGNGYVTGQTDSPVFGGQPAGTNLDVFVTKVNPTGTALVYTAIFSATGTGSGNCSGNAIAVDGSGNAYVAGSATVGFPLVLAEQGSFGGGVLDGFVLKLNSTGTSTLFSTYLGGSGRDIANGIAVDSSGTVYVAGDTFSTDFPMAGSSIQSSNKGADDAFMAKLNTSGSTLMYSTYLGGSSTDLATGIAVDGSGNAYITGLTLSSDFPTSTGTFQTAAGGNGDAFVAKIKADGTEGYSTYLGGSGGDNGFAIAVDSAGEAYVTGNTNSSNFPTLNPAQSSLKGATDVFVTKLNASGSGLVFSTYLGGTLDESGVGIALDGFGDVYVTGATTSSDFPFISSTSFQQSLSGTQDAFVTEFSNTGFVEYSSYLGGTGTEDALGGSGSGIVGAIAVDSSSNAYVTGTTNSTTGFPVSSGVLQPNNAGGLDDGFVVKVGAAPADFSVAVSPNSASVTSGQTTSAITVTVSSVNSSYGQSVSLSCGNLPAKAVCNFSPTSVTPGSTAQTSSLTIATNGASSASLMMPTNNRRGQILAAMVLPMFGVAFLGARKNPRRKRLLGFMLLGIVLAGLMILPACGGGSSGSGGGGGGGGGGTTPGTYNITVIGAAGGVSHSTPAVLTVN